MEACVGAFGTAPCVFICDRRGWQQLTELYRVNSGFLMCACFSSHFGLASMLQQDSMPTPTLSTKTLSSHKIQEVLLARSVTILRLWRGCWNPRGLLKHFQRRYWTGFFNHLIKWQHLGRYKEQSTKLSACAEYFNRWSYQTMHSSFSPASGT